MSPREFPRTFGAYEIDRRIAGSATAEVYLARARAMAGFEKHVALKMVATRALDDASVTQRLIEEARLTSRLRHRNIVQVIDLGEVEGRHYIAMEYVDGLDLGKLLDRLKTIGSPPTPVVAAFMVRELCEGLEHAHRAKGDDGRPLRIVHRDVSPSNVLVSFDGEVKLADFGLARSADRPSSTQAGMIRGKYAYLSPEQVRGHAVDARSDAFSATALLYELALGQPPYPEAPLPVLLERVSRGMILDPGSVGRTLPEALTTVLRRGLQADPAQRYASARDLSAALSAFIFAQGGAGSDEVAQLVEIAMGSRQDSVAPLAAILPDQRSDEVTRIEAFADIRARFSGGAPRAVPTTAPAPPEDLNSEAARFFETAPAQSPAFRPGPPRAPQPLPPASTVPVAASPPPTAQSVASAPEALDFPAQDALVPLPVPAPSVPGPAPMEAHVAAPPMRPSSMRAWLLCFVAAFAVLAVLAGAARRRRRAGVRPRPVPTAVRPSEGAR